MNNKITSRKILIADDEPSIRHLVSSMLSGKNTVLTAENGQQALDKIKVQRPDIVLLDIMMPKVDGYSTCAAIKKDPATSNIPVIMLTGVGHDLNRMLAEQMGANAYLTKPFNSSELIALIDKFIKL